MLWQKRSYLLMVDVEIQFETRSYSHDESVW